MPTSILHPIFNSFTIAAVVFDLHDTLVCYPNIDSFLYTELPKLCRKLNPKTMAETWRKRIAHEPLWPIHEEKELIIPLSYREIWAKRFIEGGLPQKKSRLLAETWATEVSKAPAFNGAVETVQDIGRTLPVAILSNGDTDYVHTAVDANGFNVHKVIASQEAGAAKPAGSIFKLVARELDTDPSAILFVGDSIRHDMDGAYSAGMHPVWKRPQLTAEWERNWTPTLIISSVTELIGLPTQNSP